jgi:hypothetical protein
MHTPGNSPKYIEFLLISASFVERDLMNHLFLYLFGICVITKIHHQNCLSDIKDTLRLPDNMTISSA